MTPLYNEKIPIVLESGKHAATAIHAHAPDNGQSGNFERKTNWISSNIFSKPTMFVRQLDTFHLAATLLRLAKFGEGEKRKNLCKQLF